MRVFAGPNGSGKTTIFKGILANEDIHLGTYVNADDIEADLSTENSFSFDKYNIKVNDEHIKNFFRNSNFSPVKRNDDDLWKKIKIDQNRIQLETQVDSYIAADIAEFIRQQLVNAGISLTYETVMSHPGKIDFFKTAADNGYRIYLYYIATEDPDINNSRVNIRVAQHGHAVAPEILLKRYYKSLENLKAAVKRTNRAYIFDNSGTQAKLIAEITDGIDVEINTAFEVPNWVAKYLLK